MMMKRQSHGFTLMEVLLAMTVLATSMFFLSQLQLRSMLQVYHHRAEVERIPWIKKVVYTNLLKLPEKSKKSIVQELQQPQMKMTTTIDDIDKKSPLAKYARVMRIVKTEGEWQQGNKKEKLTMIALALLPVEKRYEKK